MCRSSRAQSKKVYFSITFYSSIFREAEWFSIVPSSTITVFEISVETATIKTSLKRLGNCVKQTSLLRVNVIICRFERDHNNCDSLQHFPLNNDVALVPKQTTLIDVMREVIKVDFQRLTPASTTLC